VAAASAAARWAENRQAAAAAAEAARWAENRQAAVAAALHRNHPHP
jgi:hypothetical protein